MIKLRQFSQYPSLYHNSIQSNIPFVALVGENEMNENKVTLKNMETGEQTLVSAEELIQTLKK